MTRSESPLQLIKQSELDLRRQVDAARDQAERSIQAARADAKRTILLAGEAGRAEAAACYQQEIALAHHEAESIVAAAQGEAGAMQRRTTLTMDNVVRWIVELVVPQGPVSK